jgi:hypothetical protein
MLYEVRRPVPAQGVLEAEVRDCESIGGDLGKEIAAGKHNLVDWIFLLVRGIENFVLEESHMFVKLISEEIVDYESGLKAGIIIGNSEVGLGSVSVEPFVFRKPCTNDLIVTRDKSFRHAHIYLTPHELNCRMGEAIGEAFAVASGILNAFLKTHEEPVPDPVEIIRKLAQERQMSQKFADQAVSGYLAEPEPTRFGVINAFTRAAQALAPLQPIEIERYAGTLLQAPLAP